MDRIEPVIGEIFEINGQKYVCKAMSEWDSCQGCAFFQRGCESVRCCDNQRQDGKEVYFELVTGENAEQKANSMEE